LHVKPGACTDRRPASTYQQLIDYGLAYATDFAISLA